MFISDPNTPRATSVRGFLIQDPSDGTPGNEVPAEAVPVEVLDAHIQAIAESVAPEGGKQTILNYMYVSSSDDPVAETLHVSGQTMKISFNTLGGVYTDLIRNIDSDSIIEVHERDGIGYIKGTTPTITVKSWGIQIDFATVTIGGSLTTNTAVYLEFSNPAGSGGDSETAKRVEVPLYYQETVTAGTSLKITNSDASNVYVAKAAVGEHACYVADKDYTAGQSGDGVVGTLLGGIANLDTSGLTYGQPLYNNGSGYTTEKTHPFYQQVATVAKVGGNDGAICVNIKELRSTESKEFTAGEAIAVGDIFAEDGDGKAYIVEPSDALSKTKLYYCIAGGALDAEIIGEPGPYEVANTDFLSATNIWLGYSVTPLLDSPGTITAGDVARIVGTHNGNGTFTFDPDRSSSVV